MRIKYNVKGPHEPTQSTMTRTLSPMVRGELHVKLAHKREAKNISKAHDIKAKRMKKKIRPSCHATEMKTKKI